MTISWHVVEKLLIVSRISKVDHRNKVLPKVQVFCFLHFYWDSAYSLESNPGTKWCKFPPRDGFVRTIPCKWPVCDVFLSALLCCFSLLEALEESLSSTLWWMFPHVGGFSSSNTLGRCSVFPSPMRLSETFCSSRTLWNISGMSVL